MRVHRESEHSGCGKEWGSSLASTFSWQTRHSNWIHALKYNKRDFVRGAARKGMGQWPARIVTSPHPPFHYVSLFTVLQHIKRLIDARITRIFAHKLPCLMPVMSWAILLKGIIYASTAEACRQRGETHKLMQLKSGSSVNLKWSVKEQRVKEIDFNILNLATQL